MEKSSFSSKMFASYTNEVKKSGVLGVKPKKDLPEDDPPFKASLARSRQVAIREFKACHRSMVKLFEKFNEVEDGVTKDIQLISEKYRTYKGMWESLFETFNHQLANIFNYASESLIKSFNKKLKRIDYFTICLFGRTKAGKSTTMEALTNGSGETIGKGRQNTTKDVREYQWRELLVIDTPGIDAMERMNALESMALSYADESDLVAFLLPHQIEEGDFEKFSTDNPSAVFVENDQFQK